MYGRIKDDGCIELLHSPVLKVEGRKIVNPKPEQLIKLGYKPIETEIAEGAGPFKLRYSEEDERIVIKYEEDMK